MAADHVYFVRQLFDLLRIHEPFVCADLARNDKVDRFKMVFDQYRPGNFELVFVGIVKGEHDGFGRQWTT